MITGLTLDVCEWRETMCCGVVEQHGLNENLRNSVEARDFIMLHALREEEQCREFAHVVLTEALTPDDVREEMEEEDEFFDEDEVYDGLGGELLRLINNGETFGYATATEWVKNRNSGNLVRVITWTPDTRACIEWARQQPDWSDSVRMIQNRRRW